MCCVPLGKQTEKTHYSILIMYLKKFTITLKFTILKLFLAVKNVTPMGHRQHSPHFKYIIVRSNGMQIPFSQKFSLQWQGRKK